MFRIKICGITNVEDALAIARAGADAIGLNFYEKSCRFIDPQLAQQIVAAIPTDVFKVGVFVNHTARDIESIVSQVGLDAIQLHGDEPPQLISQLPKNIAVIRAHRCAADGLAPLAAYIAAARTAGRAPDAVLIDADAGAEFGGTGERADWDRVAAERSMLENIPLILAGGLTPQNITAAITVVGPTAVDVASGVESSPGKKDHTKLRDFITGSRAAFQATTSNR
jgi:phosphoribosylanthranilate isomerase